MRDIVDKHFIVQRQEEPPAQGLGIMNPNRNGGGGAANENEMLALRMQMEEWSGGDMW